MKVCVYGLGAVGGMLAAGLASAGCEVSAIARGATAEAVKRDGLRVRTAGGESSAAIATSEDPADFGPQDLVVLAVKAPALPEVAARLKPLIAGGTVVLSAMNGVPWWFFDGFGGSFAGTRLKSVDPDGRMAAALPSGAIVGCVVHFAASRPEPGVVSLNSPQRPLIIGEPSGGISSRAIGLAETLERAGFGTKASECIQADIWYKLWGNMTMNPLSALTGAATDRMIDDELVRGFCLEVMAEAAAIGARIGCAIGQSGAERVALTRALGSARTSMLQDVEAGRPLELDALVGAVREIGALAGVPTPRTDALFGLARLKARTLGLY